MKKKINNDDFSPVSQEFATDDELIKLFVEIFFEGFYAMKAQEGGKDAEKYAKRLKAFQLQRDFPNTFKGR